MTHDEFVKGRLFELYQTLARTVGEINSLGGRLPDGIGLVGPEGLEPDTRLHPTGDIPSARDAA